MDGTCPVHSPLTTSLDEIQLSHIDFDLLTASLITDTLPSEIPMVDIPTVCSLCNCHELRVQNLPAPQVCPCDELGPGPVSYLDSKYLPDDVGIKIFNSAYRMVDCNAGFANLIKRDKEDIIGCSPVELGVKSGNEVTQQATMRLLAGQHNTLVTIELMTNSQGEQQWVRCSVMALARDPVSGQRCFFGIMQPIPEHSGGCHVVSST
jgi:PAS domain-containing protein